MKAFGVNVPGSADSSACAIGTRKPKTSAAPVAMASNSRRVTSLRMISLRGSALDAFSNPQIRAAAANVPRHRSVDVGVAGMRGGVEQRRRRHDLPRLAIPALDDFEIEPCLLEFRAVGRGTDRFYGRDLAFTDGTDRESCKCAPLCRRDEPCKHRIEQCRSRTWCRSSAGHRATPIEAASPAARRRLPFAVDRERDHYPFLLCKAVSACDECSKD